MWSWLASFLSGPIINGVISGYKAKLASGNTSERIAADLASRELAVQQREVEAHQAIRLGMHQRWYAIENLFAYPLAFYLGKIYIWDAALHLGTTDAVTGGVAEWAMLIIMFLFGKRGIENVVRIIKA